MKHRRYPSYKESGVEWVGQVPSHWAIDRIKWSALATINGTWGEEADGVDDIICVRVADFDRERLLVVKEPRTVRAVDAGQRKTRLLRQGDLLIEKSGGGDKQLVGCVVYFAHSFPAVCSNFVARMPVAVSMQGRYWSYVHAALYAGRLNYPAIKQTTGIQNLDTSAYLNETVPFPGLEEQGAIARYLDCETLRLETLVAKKRALVERLKEKRAALISRTVTRGLPPDAARAAGFDPHPKLKPSGIAWLGDTPVNWKVVQLRRTCVVLDCKHRTVSFVADGIPLASIREVHGFEVDLTDAKRTTEDEYLDLISGDRRPRIGDIIYSRNASVGDAALVTTPEPFGMGQDVCLIRALRNIPRFLLYLFRSASIIQQVESLMIGSTFRRVNVGQVKAFWLCVPPPPEQAAIADYLDRETVRIDHMVAKVESAIERLQEYRFALITAAVTGKIDVRGHVA